MLRSSIGLDNSPLAGIGFAKAMQRDRQITIREHSTADGEVYYKATHVPTGSVGFGHSMINAAEALLAGITYAHDFRLALLKVL
jgi:hypothetical protein